MSATSMRMFDAVIIGSGPAGTGLLSCLLKLSLSGHIKPLNLCLVDARSADQTGDITEYNIPSDTRAEKFLTCLDGLPRSILSHPELSTRIQDLEAYGAKAAPLSLVGMFYRQLSQLICEYMSKNGDLVARWETRAHKAAWRTDHWEIDIEGDDGVETLRTRQLVMACGASEPVDRMDCFLKPYGLTVKDLGTTQRSSEILSADDSYAPIQHLKSLKSPKVIIVGGSHSAISSAGKLLSHDVDFADGAITLLHRSPMQVTFDTPAEARQHGVTEFTDADICPKTGRVFALKGFRLDSRDLCLAIKGYGKGSPENRVVLTSLETISAPELRQILRDADMVVSALGYFPNYIPLHIADAPNPIALNDPHFVDGNSQLLDIQKVPVPNCYALGLASNFNLAERFGEPSFTGQANGLVLWFKDIGMDLAQTLLEGSR